MGGPVDDARANPDVHDRAPRLKRWSYVAVPIVIVAAIVIANSLGSKDDQVSVIPRGDGEQLLPPEDPNGSPHIVLTDVFNPSVNPGRIVPENLRSDVNNVLSVREAELVDGSGPYDLKWTIDFDDRELSCINCAMLDVRLKEIVAAVLRSGVATDVESIAGVDTARTLAGDYSGNGWQVEFVVGGTATGLQAGESIASWILNNSAELRVYSVVWQNLFYSLNSCDGRLADAAPVSAFNSEVEDNPSARRDAALDRVVVASPSYVPQFEDRNGAQFLSGWKSTLC